MQVLVIAGERMRKELKDKPLAPGIEYHWIENPVEINDLPQVEAVIDLEFKPDPVRINWLATFLPRPVIINSVCHTLVQTHPSFIRINAWPGFLQRKIAEVSVGTDMQKTAESFFKNMGWELRMVPDEAGMISARVVAAIIQEAYFTLEAGVSSKEEIDLAMKLGTNYPMGPFEWSKKIGLKNIHELLLALYMRDSRYMICSLLEKDLHSSA